MQILVGAGVNADVIRDLQPKTGANAFHLSAKREKTAECSFGAKIADGAARTERIQFVAVRRKMQSVRRVKRLMRAAVRVRRRGRENRKRYSTTMLWSRWMKNGAETVLMGRGLGFGRRAGDEAPPDKVEKRFTLHSDQLSDRFQQLITSIPLPHFLMSERIINHAKIALGKELSDSIYVTLPDHISAAVNRYKGGHCTA